MQILLFNAIGPHNPQQRDYAEALKLVEQGVPLNESFEAALGDMSFSLTPTPDGVIDMTCLPSNDKIESTPLHLVVQDENSIESGAYALAQAMLERGANPNIRSGWMDENVPLIDVQDASFVSLLVLYGAQVDATNKNGETALMHARNAAVAEALIENGADIEAVSEGGWTPLTRAAVFGREDVIDVLLKHGASASRITGEQETDALHVTVGALQDHLGGPGDQVLASIASKLLAAGADDREDKKKEDALKIAAEAGRAECLKVIVGHLREKGVLADVIDRPDERGDTALRKAVKSGNPEAVKVLLDAGANIRQLYDKWGKQANLIYDALDSLQCIPRSGNLVWPHHFWACIGAIQTALLLLERGLNPNLGSHGLFINDKVRMAPGYEALAKVLVEKGYPLKEAEQKSLPVPAEVRESDYKCLAKLDEKEIFRIWLGTQGGWQNISHSDQQSLLNKAIAWGSDNILQDILLNETTDSGVLNAVLLDAIENASPKTIGFLLLAGNISEEGIQAAYDHLIQIGGDAFADNMEAMQIGFRKDDAPTPLTFEALLFELQELAPEDLETRIINHNLQQKHSPGNRISADLVRFHEISNLLLSYGARPVLD